MIIEITFTQEADDQCPRKHDEQSLTVSTADAGAGPYLVIETERFTFKDVDDLVRWAESLRGVLPGRAKPEPWHKGIFIAPKEKHAEDSAYGSPPWRIPTTEEAMAGEVGGMPDEGLGSALDELLPAKEGQLFKYSREEKDGRITHNFTPVNPGTLSSYPATVTFGGILNMTDDEGLQSSKKIADAWAAEIAEMSDEEFAANIERFEKIIEKRHEKNIGDYCYREEQGWERCENQCGECRMF